MLESISPSNIEVDWIHVECDSLEITIKYIAYAKLHVGVYAKMLVG